MKQKIVDARGELCPKPLIMTRKAIKDYSGPIEIILDNETAFGNVSRFLTDNGKDMTSTEDDGLFHIFIDSDGDTSRMSAAEDYCTVPVTLNTPSDKRGFVIAIKGDKMGRGDDDLGSILIQAFCNTIIELEPLPEAIVLYNSGIKLTVEGSPVLPAFKELEQHGVKILVCGTCTDYFELKNSIGAGIISNMYDIMECLAGASKVVSP
ncbi:MAG: sulfurtransferase-like selenium metabolism protein YedF [Spirochaetales bacterium]|uniref:Sulfurtransferase-like selenium metabolism protein YedF n=1 Tax=Candidatus Thalassospirochaeta sargassi TaxID=3119039 RepID=A0AAJ1IC20_9SPIO|nr:sulfurtransferase-like selenium metabolism protein YedF [Spirochaetales bacterium]